MNKLDVIQGIITNDFDTFLYGGNLIIERYVMSSVSSLPLW